MSDLSTSYLQLGSDAGGASEGQSLLSKLNIFSESSSGFLGKMDDHKVQVLGPTGKPEPQGVHESAKGSAATGLDHLARLGLVSAPQAQEAAVNRSPQSGTNEVQQVRNKSSIN